MRVDLLIILWVEWTRLGKILGGKNQFEGLPKIINFVTPGLRWYGINGRLSQVSFERIGKL